MDYFDKKHIEKIKKLNSSYLQDEKLKRLKYIYNFSIIKFELNLKRYEEQKVKFVIFGEAPPWSEKENPRYFYSKIESQLHKSFWKTFNSSPIPDNASLAYNNLAKKGFLLIDTIPYSIKYNPRIRKKEVYKELIFEHLKNELLEINKKINFDDEIKIAFAFKLNGKAIIEKFNSKINLGNKTIKLTEDMIAADGTGFPKPKTLKKIFQLK